MWDTTTRAEVASFSIPDWGRCVCFAPDGERLVTAGSFAQLWSISTGEELARMFPEEGAADVGGVMHCFTEDWEMAKQALDLGFYISFSGIITFRSADSLREVAAKVPLDRLLIETDAPYLAPVPHRGKPNYPHYVGHVADCLAEVRGIDRENLVQATRDNFFRLFSNAEPAF